jgi:hypothetical protein
MHVDVLSEIDIARPRSAVAAFTCDPMNAPVWYANIERAEWRSAPVLEVGAKVAFVAHFLGRTLAYTYEIAELVPGERLVMRTAEGPFPMETIYTFADHGAGQTHVTLRNRGEARGFSVVMAPMMIPAMRRANRKDLAKLKAVIEAR